MVTRNTTIRDRHRAALRSRKLPCAICGEPIDYDLPHTDPRSFVVDHITPLSRGGPDTLANKQPTHRDCNLAKRDHDHAPILRRSGTLSAAR